MSAGLRVELVYARPDGQAVRVLQVPPGTTLREAIERSGLLAEFPDVSLARNRIGVFGKPRGLDEPVRAGDRIEIYRPLAADPKELRRARARRGGNR